MLAGLERKEIKPGMVVIIRYEGPKGGPGMPEMLTPTSAIMGAGMGDSVALITDGRYVEYLLDAFDIFIELNCPPSPVNMHMYICIYSYRFSGGSHGFIIGHVTPEAQEGGPIALIKDGDPIIIDAEKRTISALVEDSEFKQRKKDWVRPPLKANRGTLYKYIKNVASASKGCITDG